MNIAKTFITNHTTTSAQVLLSPINFKTNHGLELSLYIFNFPESRQNFVWGEDALSSVEVLRTSYYHQSTDSWNTNTPFNGKLLQRSWHNNYLEARIRIFWH